MEIFPAIVFTALLAAPIPTISAYCIASTYKNAVERAITRPDLPILAARRVVGSADVSGSPDCTAKIAMNDITSQAIGVLLFMSATLKFIRFDAFAASVRGYGFLTNPWYVFAVSMVIVVAEGLVAAALLGRWQPWASASAMLLLLGFTGAVAYTLLRGSPPMSCGCFSLGPSRHPRPVGWHVCIRNLTIMSLLLPSFVTLADATVLLVAAGLASLSTIMYLVERNIEPTYPRN